MEYNTFAYSSIELISIPSAIPIGYNPAANSEFQSATFLNTANIYVNKTNETINAGNPDADLTGGAAPFVKYSTNKDKPMPVNYIESTQGSNNINVTLIGKVFHSNPIDWYLVFVDGVYKGRTNTTSFDITGLNPSTSYKIKFLTIDSMGNNSKFSREFNITTTA
jgi:hypothetical protein